MGAESAIQKPNEQMGIVDMINLQLSLRERVMDENGNGKGRFFANFIKVIVSTITDNWNCNMIRIMLASR